MPGFRLPAILKKEGGCEKCGPKAETSRNAAHSQVPTTLALQIKKEDFESLVRGAFRIS